MQHRLQIANALAMARAVKMQEDMSIAQHEICACSYMDVTAGRHQLPKQMQSSQQMGACQSVQNLLGARRESGALSRPFWSSSLCVPWKL